MYMTAIIILAAIVVLSIGYRRVVIDQFDDHKF